MNFRIDAVPGLLTTAGAVALLESQGKRATSRSVRRYLRRRGVVLGRVGVSLMIPPDALAGYRYGR